MAWPRHYSIRLSTCVFLCLVTILLLSLLWSPKPALQFHLDSGVSFFKSNDIPSVDDEWAVLETSVLALWITSPMINTDHWHPKPRTLTRFVTQRDPPIAEDITLATHISVNKLDTLLIQIERWGGPASVAVYFTSPDEIHVFLSFLRKHLEGLRKVTFHVVLEHGLSPNYLKHWYPHNILRNVALENIESDYFVALDVDFIPSPYAHDQLLQYLQGNMQFREDLRSHKRMFVLPAFELLPRDGEEYATKDMLPVTKGQVIKMVDEQKLFPFRKSGRVGHALTDFDKWLRQSDAPRNETLYYNITLKGDHRREVWEPYVVAYRRGIHRYWEDFRGYGYDKFSFFIESQLAGYSFAALLDLFCVHMDHPEVPRDDQAQMLERNHVYYNEFKAYLRDKYGEQAWLSVKKEK